ncbi:MAG: hypothetical protein Q8Q02_01135, partial [Nocardioides sp.]|nr:hypothetical protein [Nocardioides sp.]
MSDAPSPTPSAVPQPSGRGPVLRLAGAVAVALALVVVGLTLPGSDSGADPQAAEVEAADLRTVAEDLAAEATEDAAGDDHGPDDGHGHALAEDGSPDDGHGHDHSDPATKNAISRSLDGPETAETADPTTPAQAAEARRVVALQRAEAEPAIEPGSPGNAR